MLRQLRSPSLLGLVATLSVALWVTPTASAIANGHPDGNGHPYVGVVEFDFGNTYTLRCSGSLVAPTVFITAAHCVIFFGPATAARVAFDSEITDSTTWIPATAFYTHPDFCIGCAPGLPRFDTHDVAVVILSQQVTDKGFAALPSIDLSETLPNRTPITIVGYGAVGTSRGKPPHRFQFDGKRNYANTLLIKNESILTDEYLYVTQNPGDDRGGACFGDSGGPGLVDRTNIILATGAMSPNLNCTGITWGYRLDTQSAQDFIKSFLL